MAAKLEIRIEPDTQIRSFTDWFYLRVTNHKAVSSNFAKLLASSNEHEFRLIFIQL